MGTADALVPRAGISVSHEAKEIPMTQHVALGTPALRRRHSDDSTKAEDEPAAAVADHHRRRAGVGEERPCCTSSTVADGQRCFLCLTFLCLTFLCFSTWTGCARCPCAGGRDVRTMHAVATSATSEIAMMSDAYLEITARNLAQGCGQYNGGLIDRHGVRRWFRGADRHRDPRAPGRGVLSEPRPIRRSASSTRSAARGSCRQQRSRPGRGPCKPAVTGEERWSVRWPVARCA